MSYPIEPPSLLALAQVAFMLDGKEGGVPVDEADMDPATLKKMKKMQRKQARGR